MKEEKTTSEIQDWLISQIAELLEIDPDTIDTEKSFTDYGLSSSDVVMMSGDLEDWLDRRLSPTLAYEYPSILKLAHHLAENGAKENSNSAENTPGIPANEPIAIIGMSCRFPGANDPESFWQLLSEGVDMISEVPADRWVKEAFYHPDPAVPGKAISYWGGFLDTIDEFDPFFFGISPLEAKHMDPQQRLLLELSYEALDDAGQHKKDISGSKTGVFVGISISEYSQSQLGDPLHISSHSGTGSALSIAANRISYVFDFHGPSMAIDTACSSSLVAVHLACQSLRNGECKMALAGGVNMILSPAHSIAFTKAGVLAPDGRCKTFDAQANGYVRGEGGGVAVLKPLSVALADDDPVLAVIRGSAIAQDGRTNGLMAPSQESQEAMLREAYQAARVAPGEVQYVEAHGTGTLLGDSMEAGAIGKVIGAAQTKGTCSIGSVKTNIGHLEAAAGMAGLIKVVLSMQHRTIPPSLHYHSPNPHIPFEELNLRVQTTTEAWPDTTAPAIAGVSSFGFGGTNVHLVFSEAEPSPQQIVSNETLISTHQPDYLLPISANSQDHLSIVAAYFYDLLKTNIETTAKDICQVASFRRSQFDYRLAVVGTTRQALADSLEVYLAGGADINLFTADSILDRKPKLAFVFSGQGGQWYGMGRQLLKQEAVFYEAIIRIDQLVQSRFGWSVLEVLLAEKDELRLDEIAVVQPAIFAIQVALAELLASWGITPDAVTGHSMGEVAAAHIAGVLSLEDAVEVICVRSQHLKKLKGLGRMMVTELTLNQAKEALQDCEDTVSIAAINGPTSTVLSGDPEKMEEIMDSLQRKNLFCKWVKVDVASHSPQMDQIRPELVAELQGLQPQPASIPFYSTVTGKLDNQLDFSANYWIDNLRKPVLSSNTVEQLLVGEYTVFMEVGPHPVLLGALQQSVPDNHPEVRSLASLRREEPEQEALLKALGALYTEGYPINWKNIYPGHTKHLRLPPVPYQRERYWLDHISSGSQNAWHSLKGNGDKIHPLLGSQISLAHTPTTHLWQNTIDLARMSYLRDHQLEGETVLPATAYLEVALQALKEVGLADTCFLSDMVFKQMMILDKAKPRSLQVSLAPDGEHRYQLSIYSQNALSREWVLHATAAVVKQTEKTKETISKAELDLLREDTAAPQSVIGLYEKFQTLGVEYGQLFQGVQQIWSKENVALGRIQLPTSLQYDQQDYQIHPALLDACLQVIAATKKATAGQALYIPSGCREIHFFSQPSEVIWSKVTFSSTTTEMADSLEVDVLLFDDQQNIVIELLGFRVQRITKRKRRQLNQQDTWLYQLAWQPQQGGAINMSRPLEKRNWLVIADKEGFGHELVKQLEENGDVCQVFLSQEIIEFAEAKKENGILELLAAQLEKTGASIYGIIHLASLSVSSPSQGRTADFEQMYLLGCNSVLYLVQALSKRFAGSPRLFLVTLGAQGVQANEPVAIEQSALWGLGKVISFELPELKCIRIDLDPEQPKEESVKLLALELGQEGVEDQVAFRASQRFVHRLLPFRQMAPRGNSEILVRSDSTYLITGGLGGLGLLTAKWMVKQGARQLVLLGRSEPSATATAAITDLQREGADIIVASADVGDQEQMKALFQQMKEHLPVLRGVIHAAGVLDDGSLLNLDEERMKKVMIPKVEGTWILHEETASMPLDFFVLFSSAVSVLGAPGQGNYAAGSAYLDAMAHYRQQQGLSAISINWGPWGEVGLAAEAAARLEEQNASTQHLVKVIKAKEGLAVLDYLLATPHPQVVVLPFDLKNLLELYPTAASMPFFAEVGGSDTHVARLYARPNLRQAYVEPRNEVERKLAELWKQTLHIDRIGIHDSFFELGGDSVLAAQILALIRKAYDISINPQDAFEAFTIEKLAMMLEIEMIKQLEEMSEEEAQRRLSK